MILGEARGGPVGVVLEERGARPGTPAQERMKAGHVAHERPLLDRASPLAGGSGCDVFLEAQPDSVGERLQKSRAVLAARAYS